MAKRVGVVEAARILGISEYSIRAGIRSGGYPALRVGKSGGKILIDLEQLDAFLKCEATKNVKTEDSTIAQNGVLRRID